MVYEHRVGVLVPRDIVLGGEGSRSVRIEIANGDEFDTLRFAVAGGVIHAGAVPATDDRGGKLRHTATSNGETKIAPVAARLVAGTGRIANKR